MGGLFLGRSLEFLIINRPIDSLTLPGKGTKNSMAQLHFAIGLPLNVLNLNHTHPKAHKAQNAI